MTIATLSLAALVVALIGSRQLGDSGNARTRTSVAVVLNQCRSTRDGRLCRLLRPGRLEAFSPPSLGATAAIGRWSDPGS